MENVSSSNGLELYPKLRFKDSEDNSFPQWKTIKLKKILSQRIVKQTPTEEAPLMAFIANCGVSTKGNRYDRSYLVKNDNKLYKRTEIDDFIYSSNNLDVGSIGLNDYGTAVISDVYEIFSINNLGIPSVINDIIQQPYNMNQIIKYRQGCLYGQYRINPTDFLNVSVNIPCIEEQIKIADFFKYFDQKIAQQTKLIDDLKKYKRGLISSIWKQKWPIKKLSMLLEFQNGINASSDKYGSGIKYVSVSDILDDAYITYDSIRGLIDMDVSTIEKYSVTYGDILFQRSSETREDAGKSNVYVDRNNIATFGGFVIRGKKIGEYNPYFMKYALSTHDVRIQITSQAAGAQHINIGQKSLENIKIKYPNMEIQNQIGNMFCTLDKRISLEKKKLTNLNDIRCSLLQRLFI